MLHWHEEIQFVAVQKGVVHFKIWEKEYELSAVSYTHLDVYKRQEI